MRSVEFIIMSNKSEWNNYFINSSFDWTFHCHLNEWKAEKLVALGSRFCSRWLITVIFPHFSARHHAITRGVPRDFGPFYVVSGNRNNPAPELPCAS